MIVSFSGKLSKKIFLGEQPKNFPRQVLSRAAEKLAELNKAVEVEDLMFPPSNHLEKLCCRSHELWSVRINNQWRVIFRWMNGEAFDVEIADYH